MTHPPDPQVADNIGGWIWVGILVAFNVWTRFRQGRGLAQSIDTALDAKVTQIEGALTSLRKSLDAAITSMGRLEERIASNEKADDRLREEMHGLSGRVDAANEKYTEILVAFKAREKPKEDPVTGTVTFKEEKKKNG